MKSRTRLFEAILLLFALCAIAYPVAGFNLLQKPETKLADLVFAGPNFEGAEGQGMMAQAEGLRLTDPTLTSLYTSPVIEAPLPHRREIDTVVVWINQAAHKLLPNWSQPWGNGIGQPDQQQGQEQPQGETKTTLAHRKAYSV